MRLFTSNPLAAGTQLSRADVLLRAFVYICVDAFFELIRDSVLKNKI